MSWRHSYGWHTAYLCEEIVHKAIPAFKRDCDIILATFIFVTLRLT